MNLVSLGTTVPQQQNDIPAWIQAFAASGAIVGSWVVFLLKVYREGLRSRQKIDAMETEIAEFKIDFSDFVSECKSELSQIKIESSKTKSQLSGIDGKMDVMLGLLNAGRI